MVQIVISLVFLFGSLHSSAQWEKTNKNIQEKAGKEFLKQSDKTLSHLNKAISQKNAVLTSQIKKIAETNHVINKANSTILSNNKMIEKYKSLIKKELKGSSNQGRIYSHKGEINKLIKENKLQKNLLKQKKGYAAELTKTTDKLQKQVSEMGNAAKYMKKAGKLINYDDAIGAGFSVTGEIAAWYEGNSSFKNVVLRATMEGGKAAVSMGAGALSGAATGVLSMNPLAAGGAAVASTLATEKLYDATIGKSFNRLMDREHDAINKYAADPEKLEKMREAKREEAYKETKKIQKEILKKQDEYLDELRKYIEERNRLWAEIEEEIKQDAEKQLALEKEQIPSIVQKPSKKKIKPGESVIISIETTGGLLPIKYSGFVDYTFNNNSDRYLVSYKWTSEKKEKPGIYEFTVNATSASGKVGRSTVAIEIIDPKPAVPTTANQTETYQTDTDGERLYSASELNIKEIPGAEIRKMIYEVNGIYYGHCETPPDIKIQKFEIRLGVDPGNIEGKLGLAQFGQFAGSETFPMTESMKEAVLVKLRKNGYPQYAPYPDYLDSTYTIYFHAWGREKKFDPVSGRIWGEIEGEWSMFDTYVSKKVFKGFLEAKLNNGVIKGTVKFPIKGEDYSFPFTAKQ